MDEAARLASEMEARAKLLSDLERELASLEGERNDSLVALQEARQALDVGEPRRTRLRGEIGQREKALEDSLAEEERLASELELAPRPRPRSAARPTAEDRARHVGAPGSDLTKSAPS